ncbi:MAG: exodeoxyribonuclease VII small subunit [Lewinellaceae bacterium]|nr:exodeoxyribonuclease VII small subunit [Lewinellaceae bacterium]
MKKQPEQLSYESAFAELQQIVRVLQDDVVGIDELTAKIARATELIRFCRERLRSTEEEIGKLTDL